MPIDPSRVPALEEELWAAKRVRPGGQPPSPARIAAIEAELALHRGETPAEEKVKTARAKAKPETADADTSAQETTEA